MDYLSKAERQKLYYQGLKQASEYHLPDEDEVLSAIRKNELEPEFDAICREAAFLLFNVVAPLHRVISFILKNRYILECMSELAEQAKNNPVQCTPDDAFFTLCRVEPYTADEMIRTMDTDSATLECLRQCYQKRDRQAFTAVVKEKRCNLQTISCLCNLVWPDIIESFSQSIEDKDFAIVLDAMSVTNTKGLAESGQTLLRSMERMSDEFLKTMDGNDGDELRLLIVNREVIRNMFIWLREFYTDNVKVFKLRERRIIEALLALPEATAIHVTQKADGDGFSLPADYFSQTSGLGHADEHFNLRHEVIAAGPERFTELINYLSECDYIENSLAVKQLFAYRFSGRMRPEMVVPLEWQGRNGKSYELIYLVRTLCERANYPKMKRFFFGPQWPVGQISGHATNAEWNFGIFLNKLYPTIPVLLKKFNYN